MRRQTLEAGFLELPFTEVAREGGFAEALEVGLEAALDAGLDAAAFEEGFALDAGLA